MSVHCPKLKLRRMASPVNFQRCLTLTFGIVILQVRNASPGW